ncbi:hypothetical protein SAMN02746065_11569 [Desulfocicer vacuolatum DSM 3385]|uniref:Uncharacterized protein n=1 Tax=Desulfocicer vacuolatum DSM 3385 TaxID=1121400 RepID=A0A1W2D5P6_9BACT|nr:hypothetical protein [Desulfocicer vacuolatum]SMC92516.1 hypothetical protein SAMN02746065_11569 [Desulfocicer vacuolatum DSM 3385]
MITDQLNIPKQICKRCILPGTFPGIKFNENGLCNHCQKQIDSSQTSNTSTKKRNFRYRLDALVHDLKGTAPVYDIIVAYSGGKDSSYILKLLKEQYNLRILAMTLDNHFVSPAAIENIKVITDKLAIDTLIIRPPWAAIKPMFNLTAQKDIFSKTTLMRASSICTACIGIVKSIVLKTALEMSIPLVGYGWSPGQAPIQSAILKTNPQLIQTNQKVLINSFPLELKEKLNQYFIPDSYFKTFKEKFPHNIHPLAFFDYDEDHIKKELKKMGWKSPEDTDSNSSNCRINAYANQCHILRHGFHPYVWEIANMVRQNIMTREQGLIKIYSDQNKEMVSYAKEKLQQ